MEDIIKTLVEESTAAENEVQSLLTGEAKEGFIQKRYNGDTVRRFAHMLGEAINGSHKAEYQLREAMVTADFPYLMGDILDRSLMAQWSTRLPEWGSFCKTGTLRDFRQAKALGIEGMGAVLDGVMERSEYPERGPSEETPKYRQVAKYGARFGLSWESIINDDLDALRDLPQKLVLAARRSEALAVTQLYVGTAGPHSSVYTSGNKNIIASNPALSVSGLATGFLQFAGQVDADGFPLVIDAYTLVIPRALMVTAENILNALQINVATGGGAYNAADQIVAKNWMAGKVNVVVDDFIGLVASTNATTSWFMFASTSAARPALQMDRLRGHEAPELFIKAPNASRVGGGLVPESFETDEIEHKIRHCFGGVVVDARATVGSNGTGSA